MLKQLLTQWGDLQVMCDPITCKYGAVLILPTEECIEMMQPVYDDVYINIYYNQSSNPQKGKTITKIALVATISVNDRGFRCEKESWMTMTDEKVNAMYKVYILQKHKQQLNI